MHESEHIAPCYHLLSPAITAGLLAIISLGLVLRLYGLTAYGLWFDEAYHIELVRLPSVGEMLDAVLSNPPSDPLYVLLLRCWTAMFGTEAVSVRVLSVVFGTATIPATFFLGRYTLGTAAGIGGALFFAVSPYAIELGQEAALYALAALLTTAVLALGWRWVRVKRGLVVYTVAGVFAIYSHYVVAVILLLFAALILLFEIRNKEAGRRWIVANGLILLAWFPWLIALLAHWLNADLPRATIQHPATAGEVLGGLVQFTSGTSSLHLGLQSLDSLQQGQGLFEWPGLMQLIVIAAGLGLGTVLLLASWLLTNGSAKRAVTLMVGLSAIVYIVPALVSNINGMWLFVTHFMVFLLPSIFVCLCALLLTSKVNLPRFVRTASLAALACWLTVQAWGIVLYNRYPPHGADGLRELATFIQNEGGSGQRVFVTPPALMPMLVQYYEGDLTGLPEDFDLRRVYIPFDGEDWYSRSMSRITAKVKDSQSFWLVYRPELDEDGKLLSDLRTRYLLKSEQHYDFSDLYYFTVQP